MTRAAKPLWGVTSSVAAIVYSIRVASRSSRQAQAFSKLRQDGRGGYSHPWRHPRPPGIDLPNRTCAPSKERIKTSFRFCARSPPKSPRITSRKSSPPSQDAPEDRCAEKPQPPTTRPRLEPRLRCWPRRWREQRARWPPHARSVATCWSGVGPVARSW